MDKGLENGNKLNEIYCVKNFMSSLLSDKNKINMGDNVKFVNEFVNFVFNDTEHVEPLMIQV